MEKLIQPRKQENQVINWSFESQFFTTERSVAQQFYQLWVILSVIIAEYW